MLLLPSIFERALKEEGNYLLRTKTGSEFAFSKIEEFEDGWIKIFAAPFGEAVWIRVEEIEWIMDNRIRRG